MDKLPCIVPGCRHSVPARIFHTALGDLVGREVICSVHWRLVPPEFKRVYRRACRLFRRDPKTNLVRWNRIWARCRRAAIERSVGI